MMMIRRRRIHELTTNLQNQQKRVLMTTSQSQKPTRTSRRLLNKRLVLIYFLCVARSMGFNRSWHPTIDYKKMPIICFLKDFLHDVAVEGASVVDLQYNSTLKMQSNHNRNKSNDKEKSDGRNKNSNNAVLNFVLFKHCYHIHS
jgi:hypothetical protein